MILQLYLPGCYGQDLLSSLLLLLVYRFRGLSRRVLHITVPSPSLSNSASLRLHVWVVTVQ
jgi:hypothetical protein